MKNLSRFFLLALAMLSVMTFVLPNQVQARECYCPGHIRECWCTNRLASLNTTEAKPCCADKQAKPAATDNENPLSGIGIFGKPGQVLSQTDLHAASKSLVQSSASPPVSQSLQQRPPQQDNRYEESTFYTYQVDRANFSVRTESGAVALQGVNVINGRPELSFHVPTNGDRRAEEYHDFVVVGAGDRIQAAVRDSWSIGLFTYQGRTYRVFEYVYRDNRRR